MKYFFFLLQKFKFSEFSIYYELIRDKNLNLMKFLYYNYKIPINKDVFHFAVNYGYQEIIDFLLECKCPYYDVDFHFYQISKYIKIDPFFYDDMYEII